MNRICYQPMNSCIYGYEYDYDNADMYIIILL